MVLINIPHNAGIGNQLYMLAYAFSIRQNEKEKIFIIISNDIEKRPIIFDYLNIKNNTYIKFIRIDKIKSRKVHKFFSSFVRRVSSRIPFKNKNIELTNSRKFVELPLKNGNTYIDGYWESYKYFENKQKILQELYTPCYYINKTIMNIINKIENEESVGLHIRMGDFVELGRAFNLEYYEKAIIHIEKILKAPKFYLITTDCRVKEYFKNRSNIVIVDFESEQPDIDEWNILYKCKHHIVTNSTFSWWAAYLSNNVNKIVIKPNEKSYQKVEAYSDNYNDFYPVEWEALD